jgi:hypothetical protein
MYLCITPLAIIDMIKICHIYSEIIKGDMIRNLTNIDKRIDNNSEIDREIFYKNSSIQPASVPLSNMKKESLKLNKKVGKKSNILLQHSSFLLPRPLLSLIINISIKSCGLIMPCNHKSNKALHTLIELQITIIFHNIADKLSMRTLNTDLNTDISVNKRTGDLEKEGNCLISCQLNIESFQTYMGPIKNSELFEHLDLYSLKDLKEEYKDRNGVDGSYYKESGHRSYKGSSPTPMLSSNLSPSTGGSSKRSRGRKDPSPIPIPSKRKGKDKSVSTAIISPMNAQIFYSVTVFPSLTRSNNKQGVKNEGGEDTHNKKPIIQGISLREISDDERQSSNYKYIDLEVDNNDEDRKNENDDISDDLDDSWKIEQNVEVYVDEIEVIYI